MRERREVVDCDGAGVAAGPARPVMAAVLVLAALLALWHASRLLGATELRTAPVVLAGLACGALAADAVTGLLHWACDTWGGERTRWIGPSLIAGFRAHHREPLAMLGHGWVTVNAEAGAAACAALAAIAWTPAQEVLDACPFLYAATLALLVLGGGANQLHLWAHAPRPPRWVAALQRRGLLLSRRRHARHHAATHQAAYCIATGWLNPWLDGLGFWRALERGIEGVTGIPPRREARADARPPARADSAPGAAGGRAAPRA